MNALSIIESYPSELNPVDKWILSLVDNPSLGGWGVFLFFLITAVCTIICASIIGTEREIHGHAAGLRTHVLIALGASLIMGLSIFAFPVNNGYSRDSARLAAQVVSGIGFIGAGTIMQNGTGIRGLTTAASLWLCGGIGLAIGCGFILEGFLVTILSFAVLFLFVEIEKKTSKKNPEIVLILDAKTPVLHVALQIAERLNVTVKHISSSLITYRDMDCLKMVIILEKVSESQVTAYSDNLREATKPLDLIYNNIRFD